ncbi:MAG: nucleoside permease [Bacteroidetes bacterium]|nr:nucleoside permease [Fibrella sp.]
MTTPQTRVKLSVLLFLEFLIWGSWYVPMGTYIAKALNSADQIGSAYATNAIAAIVSPFFVGMFADKFFPAQRVLGVLHLLGAAVLYYLTTVSDFGGFYWGILVYNMLFMPTLALSNSVAFGQLANPEKDFGSIRVLGTIGWIISGYLLDLFGVAGTANLFLIGAVGSVVLGVYSFFLPNTPPKGKGQSTTFAQIIGLDALSMFRDRSFAIFFLSSLLICIPLTFYYNLTNLYLTDTGMQNVSSNMSWGQVSEIAFMLLLPVFLARLGIKNILIIAILAWVSRYLLFAYGGQNTIMLFTGILLHGICYDFFFVTGQIYTDQKAGPRYKNSAQGMITLATYGVGMFIGSLIQNAVFKAYTVNEVTQWTTVWLIPAGIAVAVLIVFVLLFNDRKRVETPVEEPVLGPV